MNQHELPRSNQINLLRAETAMILRDDELADAAWLARERPPKKGHTEDLERLREEGSKDGHEDGS